MITLVIHTKTKKGQSFKVGLSSIPENTDLLRKKILVEGKNWIIDEVIGNQSGILNLVLKPSKDPVVLPNASEVENG